MRSRVTAGAIWKRGYVKLAQACETLGFSELIRVCLTSSVIRHSWASVMNPSKFVKLQPHGDALAPVFVNVAHIISFTAGPRRVGTDLHLQGTPSHVRVTESVDEVMGLIEI